MPMPRVVIINYQLFLVHKIEVKNLLLLSTQVNKVSQAVNEVC